MSIVFEISPCTATGAATTLMLTLKPSCWKYPASIAMCTGRLVELIPASASSIASFSGRGKEADAGLPLAAATGGAAGAASVLARAAAGAPPLAGGAVPGDALGPQAGATSSARATS